MKQSTITEDPSSFDENGKLKWSLKKFFFPDKSAKKIIFATRHMLSINTVMEFCMEFRKIKAILMKDEEFARNYEEIMEEEDIDIDEFLEKILQNQKK